MGACIKGFEGLIVWSKLLVALCKRRDRKRRAGSLAICSVLPVFRKGTLAMRLLKDCETCEYHKTYLRSAMLPAKLVLQPPWPPWKYPGAFESLLQVGMCGR